MNLVDKLNQLKRYSHVWDWLEEHQFGEYVKYDDVVALFINKSDKREEEHTEILTKEQWEAFIKELENVEYDKKLAKFYSKRNHKYKISKDVKL